MSQAGETFFVSVGCMDGRVQEPVLEFGRKKFGVKFADTITEAGIVGLLAKENVDEKLLESLKFKVADVSIGMHHAKGIVVHGHQECAGNPVSDEQHIKDIKKAVEIVRSIVPPGTEIIPVFVTRSAGSLQASSGQERDSHEWVVEEL